MNAAREVLRAVPYPANLAQCHRARAETVRLLHAAHGGRTLASGVDRAGGVGGRLASRLGAAVVPGGPEANSLAGSRLDANHGRGRACLVCVGKLGFLERVMKMAIECLT